MLNKYLKKGPFYGAFFIGTLLLFKGCAPKENFINSFTKQQQNNVEIFTVRNFFTQNKFQLYFDVVNRNKEVTIGKINLYVFDRNCKNVKESDKSNKILSSDPVFIRPMQIGVVSFYPKKKVTCYTIRNIEKY
ncbi:MAG: hypothetical protein CMI74_06665 [Candidatus Pelagibacter sp.]|nr:hypothetical protein [Candidatus Pelagibacter sp.]